MICSVMRKDNSPCLELHRGALLCLTHADHGALCALLLVIVLFQNKRGGKKKLESCAEWIIIDLDILDG